MINSLSRKNAVYAIIFYRFCKILALVIIFYDKPFIWIPTVITTLLLLYWNTTRPDQNISLPVIIKSLKGLSK
ncbi:hypothetical protein GGQ84_001977 [Desulfitispora alkaliphila]